MSDNLADRVTRLERANRRLWAAALATGTVLGGMILAGAARDGPDAVRAREFVVVNAKGETRARLGLIGDKPFLHLNDSQGGTRAVMWVNEQNNVMFGLDHPAKQSRITLFLGDDGDAVLDVQERGKTSFHIPPGK